MNNLKKTALATIKGAAGAVPFVGGLVSEYIGLTADIIASKRQEEWMNMVEERLARFECEISRLAVDEFFYSCVQTATVGALKSYQSEKRELFADALYNSFSLADMAEEKKLIFLSLLDRYTLLTIRVLKTFSADGYERYDNEVQQRANPNSRNMIKTTVSHGTEKPMAYISCEIPELSKEPHLVQVIVSQLSDDGLIEPVDFGIPTYPKENRRKRTTMLGDQFIEFITA